MAGVQGDGTVASTPNLQGETAAEGAGLTPVVKHEPIPVIGKWLRRGADPLFHEFRADGTYVYEHQGRKIPGRWTLDGDRLDFKTTVADPALGVDRWVRLKERQKDTLHVLANGVRPATWERVEHTTGDRVVGTWRHTVAGNPPVTLRLRPNGHINRPRGEATWSCDGRNLLLLWPREGAPGGVWTDRCTLSTDFRSYSGTNQNGLTVRGTKIRDEL